MGGAGGAPSNNFIRSLRESGREDYLIGTSCVPADLFLANVDEKYVVPLAKSDDYRSSILALLCKTNSNFIHVQNDYEVSAVSRLRDEISELGVKYYLPDQKTVDICVDKSKSYDIWQKSGIRVPKTVLLRNENDLKKAFEQLGGEVWIRAVEGAAGQGALPTDNFEFARIWIDRFHGWGKFTAAKRLTERTVTWLSLWYQGELVVAQTRKRHSWNFGDRTLSGVTGITGVGETCSDSAIDQAALESIYAIDKRPHGIFGVDMTYDADEHPNTTEINIGRFFTTHYFFTKAGLNMPKIYCNIALDGNFPSLKKPINPLPDGLVWIRGMDVEPVLTTRKELDALAEKQP